MRWIPSWRTCSHPSFLKKLITSHPWSNWRVVKENLAEVGAAWWFEWSPSPQVIKASHWLLVAKPA